MESKRRTRNNIVPDPYSRITVPVISTHTLTHARVHVVPQEARKGGYPPQVKPKRKCQPNRCANRFTTIRWRKNLWISVFTPIRTHPLVAFTTHKSTAKIYGVELELDGGASEIGSKSSAVVARNCWNFSELKSEVRSGLHARSTRARWSCW